VLMGWKKDKAPARGSAFKGVVKTYIKGLGVLPFLPPPFHEARHRPLTYVAGGLFHLGLFVVVFLGAAHVEAWRSLLGFGWPSLPTPIVDGFAVLAFGAMVLLALNRIGSPVPRMLTGPAEWANWLFVFLPLLTGWMAFHHLWLEYKTLFALHMLSIDWLLIWIPLGRLSHFMLYFFTRTMHGAKFGKLGVEP